MQTTTLVKTALQQKNPALYKTLSDKGELNSYVMDLADQISSEVVTLGMEIAQKNGYSKTLLTDPMKAVGIMNQSKALAREQVYSQMLEFPQDETSPANQDETTSSDLMT